jgi:hypothetical protein
MSNNKEVQKIKELRVLLNKFRDVSRRFPDHDGYKRLVRQLECQIADIGEGLFKK